MSIDRSENEIKLSAIGNNQELFELQVGDYKAELPESSRQVIEYLVSQAKLSAKAYDDLESVAQGIVKPDPLFPGSDRFLDFHEAFEGFGVQGSTIEHRPGLFFEDTYVRGTHVFAENPEYIAIDFCRDPGEDYTPYHLGKRDADGRSYLIENLETYSLTEAREKGLELIASGHPEPISLPKGENDIVEVKFGEGFTGKLKTNHIYPNEAIVASIWDCEVFAPNGKSLATISYHDDPTGVLEHVKDVDKLRRDVSSARNAKMELDKSNDFPSDIPF